MDAFGLELDLEAIGFSQQIGFLYTLGSGDTLLVSYCIMFVRLRIVLLVGLCCGLVVDPMSSWLLLLCYENFIFGYFELVEHLLLSCVGI